MIFKTCLQYLKALFVKRLIIQTILLLLLNNYDLLRIFDTIIIFKTYHYFDKNVFDLFHI